MYEVLKKTREKSGYKQEELAKILGFKSKNAYSLKERGERKIYLEEAKKISHLLGKSIEELFMQTQ